MAAPVTRTPIHRISRSFCRGISAITTAPATGRNVAIVIADLSHPLIDPSLSSRAHEVRDQHDSDDREAEQERGVSLDVAVLAVAELPPEETSPGAGAVHRAVDDRSIEQ